MWVGPHGHSERGHVIEGARSYATVLREDGIWMIRVHRVVPQCAMTTIDLGASDRSEPKNTATGGGR